MSAVGQLRPVTVTLEFHEELWGDGVLTELIADCRIAGGYNVSSGLVPFLVAFNTWV